MLDIGVFGQCIGFEQVTVSSTAIGLTPSEYQSVDMGGAFKADARVAVITLEGTAGTNDIRYTMDGTTPTTSIGHVFVAAGSPNNSLVIRGLGNITKFLAIRDGGADGILSISYYV